MFSSFWKKKKVYGALVSPLGLPGSCIVESFQSCPTLSKSNLNPTDSWHLRKKNRSKVAPLSDDIFSSQNVK